MRWVGGQQGEALHLPQASGMSSGRGRGGSLMFVFSLLPVGLEYFSGISLACTWVLPPILSLAVELGLVVVSRETHHLSSRQLVALPSFWCCL